MSAVDHLSKQQFMGIEELKQVRAGDFGGTVGDMKGKWLADANKEPQGRHKDHGGPQGYLDHLAASIRERGVQEPLRIADWDSSEGPQQTLLEGHHRALAAMQVGLDKVPVDHTTYQKFFGSQI